MTERGPGGSALIELRHPLSKRLRGTQSFPSRNESDAKRHGEVPK